MNLCKLNVERINLKPNQVPYVLRALVHTILFNRIADIHVIPKDIQCPLFDQVEYVKIDSNEIERGVEQALRTIYKTIPNNGVIPIYVKMYTMITKYGFFGEYKENIEWERWCIELNLSDSCHGDVITDRIGSILDLCNKYQTNILFMKNIGFSITPSIEQESSFFDLFRSAPQLLPGMK